MASRYRIRSIAFVVALAVTACTTDPSGSSLLPTSTSSTATTTPDTTTSSAPTTTTRPPSTTLLPTTTSTTTPATSTTTSPGLDLDVEVLTPTGPGPFPAMVLVHGGAWIFGNPSAMRPLAEHFTARGFLTVNTAYQLATTSRASFPTAVDDIACAVRYAAQHPDSDGTVVLLGHSAGAHLAAVLALNPADYGANCQYPGSGRPDRFVGMAGPYDVHALGIVPFLLFGGSANILPELWEAGNPTRLAARYQGPPTLVIHGEDDAIVAYGFADQFHQALTGNGTTATLEVIPGALHNDLMSPTVSADTISDWLNN